MTLKSSRGFKGTIWLARHDYHREKLTKNLITEMEDWPRGRIKNWNQQALKLGQWLTQIYSSGEVTWNKHWKWEESLLQHQIREVHKLV